MKMSVPSGVRSAVYMAGLVASATIAVQSTDPAITTCAAGFLIGMGVLLIGSAHTASDTQIPTSSSSSSLEGKAGDSSTDATGVAGTGPWTNYPSTPMTERREPQGCHLSQDEHVLSHDDIKGLSLYGYSKALGDRLDVEPNPRGWSPYTDETGQVHRVPPNPSVYDEYVR